MTKTNKDFPYSKELFNSVLDVVKAHIKTLVIMRDKRDNSITDEVICLGVMNALVNVVRAFIEMTAGSDEQIQLSCKIFTAALKDSLTRDITH